MDEADVGDANEVQKRLTVIGELSAIEVTGESELLAQSIVTNGAIPPKAIRDAAPVAVAAVHAIDYLLTWNCKYLANAQITRRIASLCQRLGVGCQLSVRPKNSWGLNVMWEDPIVAEVRRTREELSAQFDFDVKAIFADLRRRQTALGSRLVAVKKHVDLATADDLGSGTIANPAVAVPSN